MKITVLILDDDQERHDAYCKRFQELRERLVIDAAITTVYTAKDCIEALKAHKYDLALLDHDLGGKVYVNHGDPKEDCGMRVAEFLRDNPDMLPSYVVVHSLNQPAAKDMCQKISRYAGYLPGAWGKETFHGAIQWSKFREPILIVKDQTP